MATLKIQGEEVAAAQIPELLAFELHHVREERAVVVGRERSAAGEVEIPGVRPDDLVEMHLDDGSVVVTTYERLRERVRDVPGFRGDEAGADTLPTFLSFQDTERGAGGVALRLLRVFRVTPEKEIADLVTAEAIERIEGKLSAEPGLYRLTAEGALGKRVEAPLAADGSAGPILVLLHGTASSTLGSFAGLFGTRPGGGFTPTSEWEELRRFYGDRIYALEHHTLSASPAENALELVRLLPRGAEVHLVSHSRGGLVGELVCRGGFGRGDLEVFARGERTRRAPKELEILEALGEELESKRLRVERFVRVACPAAGTLLAARRLDIYLSVLLSLFQRAAPPMAQPVLELLKATLLEVARRRSDPEELPGLEAQRPESPYAHFLNRPQARVDQDLCVIAGDLHRGSLFQSLRALVGYGYFWQKNDLVVHTRAMYAGVPREKGWVSFHEGAGVTHFSYFTEAASRARLLAALLRDDRGVRPDGFEDLYEALKKQSFSVFRGLPAAARGEVERTVLFVPDLYAVRLGPPENGALPEGDEKRKELWPSAEAISRGGLAELQRDKEVTLEGLVDTSALVGLSELLSGDSTVEPVLYDWRRGVEAAASALSAALAGRDGGAPPVAVVAHGLGALGVLELLRQVEASDGRAVDPLFERPIVLVAPPFHGSEAVLLTALGEGRLVEILRLLDGVATTSEVAGLLSSLPGLRELMPDRCLDPSWWKRAALGSPDADVLAEVARRRHRYREIAKERAGVSFLLGAGEETLTAEADDSLRLVSKPDGDGWMRNPELPEARTWYAPALHERLLMHPIGANVAADLVRSGDSARGARQPPKEQPRRHPPPLVFPSQEDLVGELLAQDVDGEVGADFILRVQVAHGSLDRLPGRPVLVGHYESDGIWRAEKFLDRCLDGRLQRRHDLGNYPGPVGTGIYVPAPRSHPEGALIVGLGDIGDLTASTLALGVERAVIERALHTIERLAAEEGRRGSEPESGPVSLPIASLLVGTRGGSLTLRQSMVAVLRGVLRAHRLLARERLDRYVTVDDVMFVELWSDVAIAAGHALHRVAEDSGLGLERGEHVLPVLPLKILSGARGTSRMGDEWSWWRRVIIREGEGTRRGSLEFVTLGERSRAEERMVFTQRPLVDELIERAPKDKSALYDGSLVNALFELLLPVPIKETVFEGRDLVLIVDRDSGRYPWELLARRSAGKVEPLVSRVRVIRQFKTSSFREVVAPARGDHALVVGEPDLGDAKIAGFPPLAGAKDEAAVALEALKQGRWDVEASVGEKSHDVIRKLFLHDYRLMHVAAHGVYEANEPEASGVVIGRNRDGSLAVLSADIFRQLRTIPDLVFLNCCHLGKLDAVPSDPKGLRTDADRTRLAASVAEAVMGLGVRALVVAGWAIDDSAANRFAGVFYRRMLRGETFGDAVHEARCAVFKDFDHTSTWGAYQCYGDPSFRLRTAPGGDEPAPHFVSEWELIGAVADVAADAASIGISAERLRILQETLRQYETVLEGHDGWRSGELLFELAEAWRATGDSERAVTLYREALHARDAGSPLVGAQQLGNLIDRLEFERVEIPAFDSPIETAALEAERSRAEGWFDWVGRLGPTFERANLRGGFLKRAAVKAGDAGDAALRRELLERAAEAYGQAVELGSRGSGPIHYYPGLNLAAIRWARNRLAWSREQDHSLRDRLRQDLIDELVEPSRESAQAEAADGETLWNVLALCEADLLESLILDRFDEASARDLARGFQHALRNFGRASDHDSARRQIELLKKLDGRSGKAAAFQIILDTFTKE